MIQRSSHCRRVHHPSRHRSRSICLFTASITSFVISSKSSKELLEYLSNDRYIIYNFDKHTKARIYLKTEVKSAEIFAVFRYYQFYLYKTFRQRILFVFAFIIVQLTETILLVEFANTVLPIRMLRKITYFPWSTVCFSSIIPCDLSKNITDHLNKHGEKF